MTLAKRSPNSFLLQKDCNNLESAVVAEVAATLVFVLHINVFSRGSNNKPIREATLERSVTSSLRSVGLPCAFILQI